MGDRYSYSLGYNITDFHSCERLQLNSIMIVGLSPLRIDSYSSNIEG